MTEKKSAKKFEVLDLQDLAKIYGKLDTDQNSLTDSLFSPIFLNEIM